jgi:serine/threonine-protein kinase
MSPDTAGPSYPEIDGRRSFLDGLVGMRIADRYEVTRVLGQGGMGVVVEARHAELDRRVAIKFMFPEYLNNEVLAARFSREAKLAAKVHSPHIVRVVDVGKLSNGVPYLVMDMLSGHDLGAEIDRTGPLSVEKAVDYILQACAGLAALHAIGVVHRDLKPSNLFLADVAGVPTVTILDFGISKDITAPSASITSTETQLGTPMYMSPEQIRASKNVDVRSDIWALGVILYELLTGTLPFERSGNSIGELFAVILMTEPVPLCMRRPELPAALEEVVMRCLRRGSWDRYDNVVAFAEALRPFAKPSSLHRIDTVRRALGTPVPSSDMGPSQPESTQAPTLDGAVADARRPASPPAAAAIAQTTPATSDGLAPLKLEVDYPVAPQAGGAPMRAPGPSPSLASSSRSFTGDSSGGTRGRSLVWAFGVGAAIVGAAATFAIRATSTGAVVSDPAAQPPPPVAAPPPAVASDPPPPVVAAPAHPEPSARPAVASPALPPVAPVAPPVVRPSQPAKPSAPVARPSPPPAGSATATAAPPRAPTTDDLILDRK